MTKEEKQTEENGGISKEHIKLTKDVLKIIAESNVSLGNRDIATEPERYKEVALKIIRLLMSKNAELGEVELMFQLMRQAIGIIEVAVKGSLDMSMNIALENYWGKHPEDITLQDIDAKMKKDK